MKKLEYSLWQVFDWPKEHFMGNVAAVVILEDKLENEEKQRIAANLNQPATAFIHKLQKPSAVYVQWFAPDAEIDLCGHGLMAGVFALAEKYPEQDQFHQKYAGGTVSGRALSTLKAQIEIEPISIVKEVSIDPNLEKALGIPLAKHFKTNNKDLVVAHSQGDVATMKPNYELLRAIPTFGYTITAKAESEMAVDFVSRTLVPHVQQLEDHATGSSHAVLFPYWSAQLNKNSLKAVQLSPRGGYFEGIMEGDNLKMSGFGKCLATGQLHL